MPAAPSTAIRPQPRWRRRRTSARLAAAVAERAAAQGFALDDAQSTALERLTEAAGSALGRGGTGPRGVYLWGPPGRGKTWLLGAFFDALPTPDKRRLHFHEFFHELHGRAHLATMEAAERRRTGAGTGGTAAAQAATAGTGNAAHGTVGTGTTGTTGSGSATAPPAGPVAARRTAISQAIDEMLGETRVLCFDEFHCNDPGDAMLLTRTLERILERGILLVATSNYAPDGLLPDEYFHHLAEPAIALITSRLDVVEVAGRVDYRTLVPAPGHRTGYAAGSHLPSAAPELVRSRGLVPPQGHERRVLRPTTKDIAARRAADGQVWFDFAALCDAPTATVDYLALAAEHGHWVVDGIPPGSELTAFALRRLGNVVDVLYDRDLRLDLLGGADLEGACGLLPETDAARLRSRLAALASG